MNKKYKLGMILGRFQILHIGHESIINLGLENCEKVLIFIGSSDKHDSYENPFNYDFRKKMIEEIYQDKVIVAPLPDLGVGNVSKWGDYVIDNAIKVCGMPDCIIYGEEDKCRTWYTNYKNLNYLKVDRGIINICTTDLKKLILNNEYNEFIKYVNPKIVKYYDTIKEKINSFKC